MTAIVYFYLFAILALRVKSHFLQRNVRNVLRNVLIVDHHVIIYLYIYIVFSHDVTAAILVSQNNETVAIWVSQTNPVGV